MSCDIVDFPPPPPPPPKRLIHAAEAALDLLRLAHESLSALPQRGRAAQCCVLVEMAIRDLDCAVAAHSEAAGRDLREIVLTALGPNLKYGEIIGARRALELVRDCLDFDTPAGEGGVA